ncbi:lactase/phlorizin hydrolase-like [Anticarsia gemmatalis]|uniref:lactase/phlorizin hydrolase-like n=1 Tax=Anticarsia gemmatalis TaxID=129554 RepID=UPI003F75F834
MCKLIVLAALICSSSAAEYKFPSGFMFGAASAAYQVEGAWNVSDKGESIWDRLLHTHPELVADGSNGDVACDSYHLWQRDIEMLEEMGMNMYRFSISWPRLLPTGFPNIISEDGKRYYNDLIDGLLAKGIEPVVTLYHFDLPQPLQDLGGWANPLISDWFADYADVVFSLYANRVKIWLTLNEPIGICESGYEEMAAPYIDDPAVGRYLCNKNTLIAHAKAYRVYDEVYRPMFNGKVSIVTLFLWFEPETPEDIEVTELAIQHWEGRYAHPIFSKEGGWPKKLEAVLLQNSIEEGFSHPRLPPFTPEEIILVRGTYDFYSLNHYTTRLVRKVTPRQAAKAWPFYGSTEIGMDFVSDPAWKNSILDWFQIYPEGLRKQLHWLKTTYDVKEIMIMENGLVTVDPGLYDVDRLEYTRDYLEQIAIAINEGIPITGYTAWTLMDNFEWLAGYSVKFGLYAVDFNDPNRTRTPRESARFYGSVAKSRMLNTTVTNNISFIVFEAKEIVYGQLAINKMDCVRLAVFSILISGSWCSVTNDLKFPEWFKFGAATAAYQVEGGWNASDKGESIWDRLLHQPDFSGRDSGDVACDSYHLWRRDIEMAVELGLDVYRFSISWTRLLPNGFANKISEDGKRYYNNLIDGLLEKGIEPVVTIYHFDLPQILQDLGGWTNPLISDWFADYARVVFTLFGDRVKTWLTLNEPFGFCESGYNKQQAPYIDDVTVAKYLCNKYTLMSHAKAWRIYDEEFRPKYHGKVSIASLFIWYEPFTPEDKEVTDLTIAYWEGRYGYPIFSKEGGWPPTVEKFLADKSKREGYPRSRLPPFTPEEIELVRGTHDFYGLNHYTSRLIRKARPGEKIGTWPLYGSDEINIQMESDPSWETTALDWFTLYPEGLRKQLHWLNQTYGVKEVMITENGYVDFSKRLDDWGRLKCIRNYLEQVQLAISDGLNVTGYIAWTLMDNLEWLGGYSVNFGLYQVDFADDNRTRTPRESARYYSRVTRTRSLHHAHEGLNYV